MSEKSSSAWHVLVVDDDRDVHAVTRLALKNRSWQRRRFELHSAMSASEARAILIDQRSVRFEVAVIDVVMETRTSGLELCRFLRTALPPSLRIVLRTGQPGAAPEEEILNTFDIDYYLDKSSVTPERLYAVIRACLRSSQDISALLAYAACTKEISARLVQDFSHSLQETSSINDLLLITRQGLKFFELKHDVRVLFIPDMREFASIPDAIMADIKADADALRRALASGHEQTSMLDDLWTGPALGLPNDGLAVPFSFTLEASTDVIRGALYCETADAINVDTIARRLLPTRRCSSRVGRSRSTRFI